MRQIDIEMMCDAPDELCVKFLLFLLPLHAENLSDYGKQHDS
jgi:hypothetical protein